MAKIIGWILGIIVLLILIVVVGGYLGVRSGAVQHFLIAKVDQRLEQATGAKAQIQSVSLHLSQLSVDAYGVVLHGTETDPSHPLLSIDLVSLRFRIVSLLHRRVDLSDITVEHPVARLVTYRSGQSNLPSPPPAKKQSQPVNVFNLGIQHVLLENGEVYYNGEKMSISGELRDLRTAVNYVPPNSQYDGTLSYREGELQVGNKRPLPHELNAKFSVDPSRFSLDSAVLKIGNSSARLQATVNDFSSPRVDGSYEISIQTRDFQPLAPPGSALPVGDIGLTGKLQYESSPRQAFLRGVKVDGRLESRELALDTAQARAQIRSLHASYRLADGDLVVDGLGADALGGHLSAQARIQHLDTNPTSRVQAALQSISLQAIREAARSAQLKNMPIAGRVNGNIEAAWTGSLQTMQARTEFSLKGTLERSASSRAALLPLEGSARVAYDAPSQRITVSQAFLRTPQSRVEVQGSLDRRSSLQVQAETGDLGELSRVAANLGKKPGSAKALNLSGSARLQAQVRGAISAPRITGQFSAQNLQVERGQWRSLQFAFQASPSAISVQRGSLTAMRQGQASFDLNIGLRKWKYLASDPIAVQLSLRQMSIAELEDLGRVDYPVSGNLSADVSLRGSQLQPLGNGSVSLTRAKIYGQTVQNLTLQFQGSQDGVHSTLQVKTPAGNAGANLVLYPKSKGYEVQLNAPNINLQQLDVLQRRNLGIAGALTVSASGKGTMDNPQLTATAEVPQLQARQAVLQQVRAQVKLADHRAEFGMSSQLLESSVQVRGSLDLRGDQHLEASLDTKGLPLPQLIGLFKPMPPEFQGQLELHASAKGPLKDTSRMEAHLTIPMLRAAYKQLEIGNVRPIQVDYANSVITVATTELRGTDSSLQFGGQIPLRGPGVPHLSVQGTVDTQLVGIFEPDLQSSGKVALDIRAVRAGSSPLGIQGQVRLENIAFASTSLPLGVQNLNGVLDIDENQVRITQLSAQSGGGQFTAGGAVIYRPAIRFNTTLNARRIRLRYPEGLRAILDSNLALVGTPQESSLNGRVLIDSLGFTPEFDLASFAGQFAGSGASGAPPAPRGFTQNLKLNVALQSASQLNLINPEISLQGQVNLRVVGTAADPVIVGRTDFTGGDLFFQNRRYQLQHAIIDFMNPNQTQPVVNAVITTTVSQYNLTLTFLGPVDRLRTSYSSDPPLSPVDIINLIARGTTTEQAGPTNVSANAILAQGMAGQISGRLQKLAGFSSLQIDPTVGGNGTDPTARIAVQKRVTKDFIFTYSTDVRDPESQFVQGEYQITKHWSVTVDRDQNGGVAVSGQFHTEY